MRILVFEWLVGGGVAGDQSLSPDDPFLAQGADMYGAIVDDCLELGFEVASPLDPQRAERIVNFEELRHNDNVQFTPVTSAGQIKQTLLSLAQRADHILLIAPECEGILNRCVQWLDEFQSKLLCGPKNLIEIFANKNATQELLTSKGIAVPQGIALTPDILVGGVEKALRRIITATDGIAWPLVVKPSDGAGGENVLLCSNPQQLQWAITMQTKCTEDLRAERYIAGTPASVSIARNQHETRLLPATKQQFSNACQQRRPLDFEKTTPEPIGHFLKSTYPLEYKLRQRAETLAASVADALPTWRGYLGIDMVLADEGPDVVVELNPRLTASYPTVCADGQFNLIRFLLGVKVK